MEELRVLLGGPQGAGLETAAQVLTTSYAALGYRVYSTREYYSNIKGRHSYINVRISPTRLPMAPRELPHIIAAIDAETVLTHFTEAAAGTVIIYDKNLEGAGAGRIASMEPGVRNRIIRLLEGSGYPASVGGALAYARDRLAAEPVGLDYRALLRRLAERAGMSLHQARRFQNTIPLAAVALLSGLPVEELEEGFRRRWPGRERVIRGNTLLAEIVYEELSMLEGRFRLPRPEGAPEEFFIVSGNDAVAMGKLVGGLRVQTYYPITPAADESFALEAREDLDSVREGLGGVIVFQTEDEIAAIAAAIGAALTGARAATATSGPGFDLMVEALGWAGINEVPVVITYYQRGGPSTGLPTRGGQQDLFSALFSGHGEFPRIVLASGDHEEAFYDAVLAFNLAERYQTPVIHLLDKFLANSIVTMSPPDTTSLEIDRGLLTWEPPEGYKRFDKTRGPISLRAPIGAPGAVMWYTGDEHDEHGHISEDPENRILMHAARMEKLEIADREIPEEGVRARLYGGGGDFLLVGWGSTKGAALEALEVLEGEGLRGAYLHVRFFEPFPRRFVGQLLSRYGRERVIIVEASATGMLGRIIAMNTGFTPERFILKWTGRPIYVGELAHAVYRIIVGGSRREVLRYGA